MAIVDELIEVCEKLPGFYGYRPSFVKNEVIIEEIIFSIKSEEENCEYIINIYLKENKCVSSKIDARYDDLSLAQIFDEEEEFKEIVTYKNQLIKGLNQKISILEKSN